MIRRQRRWSVRRQPSALPVHESQGGQGPSDPGFFTNAHNLVINEGHFTNVNETISNKNAVFELLKPYTCVGATKDSYIRHPPPKCHPGTRQKFRKRLMCSIVNEYDQWKTLWVHGFAGTGKSAIAQSIADSCEEKGILGATYFFFRAAGTHKPKAVVPTLIYQLATSVPEYRSLIEQRIVQNPFLLENSAPVQFRKLVVEPFIILQRESPRSPIIIILDGLDECKGEQAQLEILKMINDATCTNPDLPLRWLIFSRPEAHLKNAFFRSTQCRCAEVVVDADCLADVEKYIKDSLFDIKAAYNDITTPDWPLQADLDELLDGVSGLFVLASTCVDYIGYRKEPDPVSRLRALLMFMRRPEYVVPKSPLANLDLLYSRILGNIPSSVFITTQRILATVSYFNLYGHDSVFFSAQALANFLRLDQCEFYNAVRGLHSIMWIPDPEVANDFPLQYHHASLEQFLSRPGKYGLDELKVSLDIITCGIYWCQMDSAYFQTCHDHSSYNEHFGDHSLPGLSWLRHRDEGWPLSTSIMEFVHSCVFDAYAPPLLVEMEPSISSQLCDVDFRYWDAAVLYNLIRTCRFDSSTSFVRVEPSSSTDRRLLEYFKFVIKNGVAKPASLPLEQLWDTATIWARDYFFIGYDAKSVIVWITKVASTDQGRVDALGCDEKPSERYRDEYEEDLRELGWDEEAAALAMNGQPLGLVGD